MYVDNGLQAMAAGIDAKSFDGYQFSYPFEMPGCPPAPVPGRASDGFSTARTWRASRARL